MIGIGKQKMYIYPDVNTLKVRQLQKVATIQDIRDAKALAKEFNFRINYREALLVILREKSNDNLQRWYYYMVRDIACQKQAGRDKQKTAHRQWVKENLVVICCSGGCGRRYEMLKRQVIKNDFYVCRNEWCQTVVNRNINQYIDCHKIDQEVIIKYKYHKGQKLLGIDCYTVDKNNQKHFGICGEEPIWLIADETKTVNVLRYDQIVRKTKKELIKDANVTLASAGQLNRFIDKQQRQKIKDLMNKKRINLKSAIVEVMSNELNCDLDDWFRFNLYMDYQKTMEARERRRRPLSQQPVRKIRKALIDNILPDMWFWRAKEGMSGKQIEAEIDDLIGKTINDKIRTIQSGWLERYTIEKVRHKEEICQKQV